MVGEALECLGGNGYVEESGMPLLFRESPLNSIWEGSGNVNALDVLRALEREPEVLDAWLTEIGRVKGENPHLDAAVHQVLTGLADLSKAEGSARRLASTMAVCLQGALLVGGDSPEVADLFCASRLGGDWAGTYGTLPAGPELAAVVRRTTPTR
jgi:putative acyl-CoA dehydrogenase